MQEPRWTIIQFGASLVWNECNWNSNDSRPNVSTLLSNVFIRGDLKLLQNFLCCIQFKPEQRQTISGQNHFSKSCRRFRSLSFLLIFTFKSFSLRTYTYFCIDYWFFSLIISLETSSKHYCLSLSDLRARLDDQEENWTQTKLQGILYRKLLIAL